TELRDFGRRQCGGELVARFGENTGEIGFGKTIGKPVEDFRRLIQPQAGNEFGGLFGMFQPRRLPGHVGYQIGFAAQSPGDGLRGGGGQFGVGRLDSDDEFAGVGEMLLINFEADNGGNITGQQIEHFGVETQVRYSSDNWNKQQKPPPMKPARFHKEVPFVAAQGWSSRFSVSPNKLKLKHQLIFMGKMCLPKFRLCADLPAATRSSSHARIANWG